jgi:hypothetical protein
MLNNVFLSKVSVSSLPGLKEDLEQEIRTLHSHLLVLAASSPRTIEDPDGNKLDWSDYCVQRVQEIITDLKAAAVQLDKVEYALLNPEDVKED